MIVVVKLDALALVIPRVAAGAVPRPAFATPEIIFRSLFDVVGRQGPASRPCRNQTILHWSTPVLRRLRPAFAVTSVNVPLPLL
jgi:hypothetical protein